MFTPHKHRLLPALLLALSPATTLAGGPKYVAGTTFFNPGVTGQPIHWANGQVNYYTDQGPLSASVSNQQATAMVDAAAALWSAVPTAAVTLTDQGPLNEDVSASTILVNNSNQIAQPADITPAAANYPLAVVYDADGSLIDALYGETASQPTSCQNNGVFVWIDNLNPDATIAHAVILLNGLCATNASLVQMMSYQIERAFGRVLGLDYAQVNPGALQNSTPGGTQGWPIMHPLSGVCGASGGECIPNPTVLRYDDIAALNRIYPITAQNLSAFPGKQLTADNTVSIRGTISFRTGSGMQGVNVVARPLDADGNPLYQYTVTALSGAAFSGNHGNPATGFSDSHGTPYSQWGSTDPAFQGAFDLSAIPLPPGMTSASYQLTFESVNPLYILTNSVGPYAAGQVAPSGTLAPIALPNLSPGSTQTVDLTVADSATGGYQDAIGTEASPRSMPASGLWVGRLSQTGQSDWFSFPVRGQRTFTIVTQALDETGAPTDAKAMPSIGIWNAFRPTGAPADVSTPGINGNATGETWLRANSRDDGLARIAITDLRGDGRPDYAYAGWVLYADTVQPARLPATGGPIVIHGMGFRPADTVLVNGQPAQVTSLSPNEITAIAPASAPGVTGSVDVEVDDLPAFNAAAILSGAISYNSGSADALTLVTAPANTVPIATPIPFTVTALGPDLSPAGGVTVLYTVTSGTATLACGQPTCTVIATGDGRASLNVIANTSALSIVTASLTNGSSLQAHFSGGTPAVLSSLTPQLSLAAGATVSWTVQALALTNGQPAANQTVLWQSSATGIAALSPASAVTDASGIVTKTLTVGPLAPGQTASLNACVNGTSQCVTFTAFGARTQYAWLQPISGTTQTLAPGTAPSPIVLRLLDMNGNPMAAGTASIYQALFAWTPPCSPHTVCKPSVLLATQTATATADLAGIITFTPATLPGVATSLTGLAATGNTATVPISIQQH